MNPIKFINQFNEAVEDFGLSKKEKIAMFRSKIRAQDYYWREGLDPKKHRLQDYQRALRNEYYGRSERKMVKAEFRKSCDVETILSHVRKWYAALRQLNDVEFAENEDIIDELIKKLPGFMRPYLGNKPYEELHNGFLFLIFLSVSY